MVRVAIAQDHSNGSLPPAQVPVLIWLHGLGEEAKNLLSILAFLTGSGCVPGLRVVIPQGDKRRQGVGGLQVKMTSWYEIKAIKHAELVEDIPGLEKACALIADVIRDEVEHGIDPQNIVLGGHSQGAAVALLTAMSFCPYKLGGLILLNVYCPNVQSVIYNKGMGWIPPFHRFRAQNLTTPVFVSHAYADERIPWVWARRLCSMLRAMGTPVELRLCRKKTTHNFGANRDEILFILHALKTLFVERTIPLPSPPTIPPAPPSTVMLFSNTGEFVRHIKQTKEDEVCNNTTTIASADELGIRSPPLGALPPYETWSPDEILRYTLIARDASIRSDISTLNSIFGAGLPIDATDDNGWTCLHHSLYDAQVTAANHLCNLGANQNAKDIDGATPLHVLLRRDTFGYNPLDAQLVRFFVLSWSPDINARDNSGVTVTQLMRRYPSVRFMRLLPLPLVRKQNRFVGRNFLAVSFWALFMGLHWFGIQKAESNGITDEGEGKKLFLPIWVLWYMLFTTSGLQVLTWFKDPGYLGAGRSAKGLPRTTSHPPHWKYCISCAVFRPPRSKHCHTCRSCVELMDHHCMWTGNCIGKGNMLAFFCFYMSVLVTSACSSLMLLQAIIILSPQISGWSEWTQWIVLELALIATLFFFAPQFSDIVGGWVRNQLTVEAKKRSVLPSKPRSIAQALQNFLGIVGLTQHVPEPLWAVEDSV